MAYNIIEKKEIEKIKWIRGVDCKINIEIKSSCWN